MAAVGGFPQGLVLVCSDRLDVDPESIAEAKRKGHHVLQPVSSIRTQGSGVVKLERMDRGDLARY